MLNDQPFVANADELTTHRASQRASPSQRVSRSVADSSWVRVGDELTDVPEPIPQVRVNAMPALGTDHAGLVFTCCIVVDALLLFEHFVEFGWIGLVDGISGVDVLVLP